MASVERSTDIVEERSETAFIWGGCGIGLLLLGALLWYYNKDGGALIYLAYLLLLGGLGSTGYGAYAALQIRKVQSFTYACPYCKARNGLAAEPETDFTCI